MRTCPTIVIALAVLPLWAGVAAARGKKDAASGQAGPVHLQRVWEPREQAFTVLVPQGWVTEGGVVRVDPRLGPTNSVGAKIDFSVKRDPAGTTMIHWLPNITYKDPRYLVGGFPVGSNYMGMMVYPMQDPLSFLTQMVFRQQRPQAQNVQIVEQGPLPQAAQKFQRQSVVPNVQYQAGAITLVYDEGGIRYREKMVAVVEAMMGEGLGMWTNRATTTVRAPEAEFDRAQRLLALIEGSLQGNPQWVSGENRGAAQRAQNALDTQRHLQDQSRKMLDKKRENHAEIRHSSWLFLTGQEDYVNPHTGRVEQGSNQYKRRWVNGSGDVIYTDDSSYDPRADPNLQGRTSDFQLSRVRKR